MELPGQRVRLLEQAMKLRAPVSIVVGMTPQEPTSVSRNTSIDLCEGLFPSPE